MARENYILVLDTNVLYKNYNNTPNFKEFAFAPVFDDIQSKIEELDIVDIVSVAVPEMCWEELKIQYIDEHKSKLQQAISSLNKYSELPEISFEINDNIDIVKTSNDHIKIYKEKVLNNQSGTKTIELSIPDDSCFKNIISRAINKSFPFHVTDKHSDYGFKDVVIWESILKYKSENKDIKILLYSVDGGFNDCLLAEYENIFNDKLNIIRNKEDLYSILEEIAKKNVVDVKIYTPSPVGDEIVKIEKWLATQEFKNEIWRVIDKALLDPINLVKETNVLDYKFISSHVDYDNYQMWMEILLCFQFETLNKLTNKESQLINKYLICIDLPYEEELPILIMECKAGSKEETDEWLKQLEK